MLDARDLLGGLLGLIDVLLTGNRSRQHDNAIARRDIDIAAGRGRRNLRFHCCRDLAVRSHRFTAACGRAGTGRCLLPGLPSSLLCLGGCALRSR